MVDVNYWLAIAAEELRRQKIDEEYEEMLNDNELLRQYEAMSHAADLESFSPFDTINA